MTSPILRIAIGTDHGAVELKNAVLKHLQTAGHEVRDFGTNSHESVDYSDYANLVATPPATYRVMRGGSFLHRAGQLRAAKRGYNLAWGSSSASGVRCARGVP